MAVLWELPGWLWGVVAGVALAGAFVVLRALARVFVALGELRESVEISKRVLTATLETAKHEAERAQEGLGRLRRDRGEDAAETAYQDW